MPKGRYTKTHDEQLTSDGFTKRSDGVWVRRKSWTDWCKPVPMDRGEWYLEINIGEPPELIEANV